MVHFPEIIEKTYDNKQHSTGIISPHIRKRQKKKTAEGNTQGHAKTPDQRFGNGMHLAAVRMVNKTQFRGNAGEPWKKEHGDKKWYQKNQ